MCQYRETRISVKGYSERTHRSNNLRLKPILILKPASKVTYTSLAIRNHIRDFSNVVEHVSAREEENGNQADGGPSVPVLDHGQDVWCRDCEEGDHAQDCGEDEGDFEVVDWSDEGWVWDVGELAR